MTYLTVEQVAELLQASTRTVARWAADDSSFPAMRVGRVLRVESGALDTWLRGKTQGQRSARRSAKLVSAA